MIKIKRVYEVPSPDDGQRILVERLWPRGFTKEAAKIDLWLKDISPSTELRRWFHRQPDKWSEFKERYFAELKARSGEVAKLMAEIQKGPVTFIFSARDTKRNSAIVLKEYLERHILEP